MRNIISLSLLLLTLGGVAAAQEFRFPSASSSPLPVEEAFRMEVLDVGDGRAEIGWKIAPGYYLYRDNFSARSPDGSPIAIETFPGLVKDDPTFGTVEVHYNQAQVILSQAGGTVLLTWQGCQEDGICYRPVEAQLDLPPLEEGPDVLAADLAPIAPPDLRLATSDALVSGFADRGGVPLVLLGFFGLGLLLSLTPCTFPMVPILAGILAGDGERLSARRGAVLSGTYIIAMAAAFAALGAVAGWSGRNLQMVLQSPWAIGTVALLFAVLALSSFGLFELRMPAFAGAGDHRGERGSIRQAASLGFTSALILGPCVTAPLAGALLYIAQSGNIALGAAALFALGLGQGAPLFVAGTFGGHLLPNAGAWMEATRPVFGLLFLGMAIWLSARILPGPLTLGLWALLAAGVAMLMRPFERGDARLPLRQTSGIALLFAGALLGIGAALGANDPLRPLAPLTAIRGTAEGPALAFGDVDTLEDLRSAMVAAPSRPVMLYVTADWCVICRGIERNLWQDSQVITALDGVITLKLDVTNPGHEAIMASLGVAGPPTILFLGADGREPGDSRRIGATDQESFLSGLASLDESPQ